MKRIDWLVLRMYMGPFIMGLAIILFMLVLQFMSLYLDDIAGKGLSVWILFKFFYYAGGRLLLNALPIAVLVAGLMTFGSLGEHYELASIKSCGISLLKAMRSLIVLGVAITGIAIWISFDLIPQANLKFFSLYYDVQRKKADVAIEPGHFYSDIDNYVIRVSDKNLETGTLYDIMIYDHTENRGNNDLIVADSARMNLRGKTMQMTLYNGIRYEEYKSEAGKPNSYPHGRTKFDSLYYRFVLKGFDLQNTDESRFRHQVTMPMKRLQGALDSLESLKDRNHFKSLKQVGRYNKMDTAYFMGTVDTVAVPDTAVWSTPSVVEQGDFLDSVKVEDRLDLLNRAVVNARAVKSYVEFMVKKEEDQKKADMRYQYEYYNRYALPFNCLVFLLIGVSMGAIIQKGGLGAPALVAIVLFFLFYVLTTNGRKFAKEGVFEPWLGAWFSVIIFTPIAIYITYSAVTDSPLFNESFWGSVRDSITNSIRNLFKKKTRELDAGDDSV
ncbi:LptF/LptG family permease [Pontibacter sp. G13]|uniref:LptF/LptG family permease n=1 Tax=Pontibacter sp. G13 TaxID=3074898 RepID=UPI00288C0B2E|nr:LptF/LptG family permease [Pontibacter sp. G13]WNJ20520.1 LptF/LptG family permease [Pontibacter sp. G13]